MRICSHLKASLSGVHQILMKKMEGRVVEWGKPPLSVGPRRVVGKAQSSTVQYSLSEANSVTHRDTLKTHFGWGKLKEKISLLLDFK